MKKIILLAVVALGAQQHTQAQSIGKGTGLLSGSIGYSSDSETYENTAGSTNSTTTIRFSTFSINAAVGTFVADNFAIGLDVNHTATGGKYEASNNSFPLRQPAAATTLRVGPFAQYYRMVSEQFGLFGTLGAGYASDYKQTGSGAGGYSNLYGRGFYASLTPGIVFLPIPKFGLTATMGSLGYTRLNITTEDQPDGFEDVASSFAAGFGIRQLQFGGVYYFGRK